MKLEGNKDDSSKSDEKKASRTIRMSKKEIRARKLKQKVQNKNNKNIGPECGTDNLVNAEFCQEGGFKLEKSAKKTFFKSLDYKALLIGTLISIILFYALPGQYYLVLLGALASGFIAGGSYKRGAVHGAIPLVTLFIPMAVMISIGLAESSKFLIGLILIFLLPCLFYSVIGAFLGVIGVWISKIKKDQKESIRDDSEVNPNEETKTDQGWWERKTPNEKWKIGYISFIVIIWTISIVAGVYISLNVTPNSSNGIVDSNNTTETKTSTPTTTPTVSAEDKYRQWVKEDYQRFVKAKDSSEMYSLYQGAQSVSPPEKYKEFHQHYIQSYYYWYKAYEAGDNGDTASYEYYLNLANQEDTKLSELMPDYLQLTQG